VERLRSAGDALRDAADALGFAPMLARYTAVAAWAEVVGPQIASMTEAVRCENGVLLVRVANAPWRAELALRRREIIRRLNEAVGRPAVKDIRFR
jgi:predicted nucleic acid-binding Zn ribbon protein